MKLLFDLFPVILFFAVFKLHGIYTATAAAIAATVVQIVWSKWRHDKVDKMLWVSFGIIAVLGSATLLLHDESFIKWKPTVLYWVFASILLFSRVLFRKNLLRALLQEKLTLPDTVWDRLNLAWSAFFAALGILNLYVAFSYPLETWVNFKLFGTTGLMFAFILLQAFALSKYMEEDQEHKEP
ncbi:MAG: septation protein A [Gallionellaceae bacterium]|jgi:intracellular septation protein|nr:septation protein A [Gallionellaceae bacterium]